MTGVSKTSVPGPGIGVSGSVPPSDVLPLVTIVIATFNERDNIVRTINAVFAHVRSPVEIVVVDDESPDDTAAVVRALNDERIRVVTRRSAKGLASAILRGLMESRGELVGWIDADMAPEVPYLSGMIALAADHDVVIASRFAPGGGDTRHPFRVYASRLVNGFARAVLGYGIGDYDSCVVIVRRRVFDTVMPIAYGFGEFFIEFVRDCCRRGLRVVEFPYVLGVRDGGNSKSFPNLRGFLWLGAKYCMRIIAARFRGN